MVLIEDQEYLSEEEKRLKDDRERTVYWKRWGPYVSERQWSTGQSSLCCHLVLANMLQSAKTTREWHFPMYPAVSC
jgi:hypothetical protein